MEVKIKLPGWGQIKTRILQALPKWKMPKASRPTIQMAGSWGARFNKAVALGFAMVSIPLIISSLFVGSVFFLIYLVVGLYLAGFVLRKAKRRSPQ